MRLIVVIALAATLWQLSPLAAAPARAQAQGAALNGTAVSSQGQTLANYTVRIRLVNQNGAIIGSTTSNTAGQFSFTALNPDFYVVEIVNAAGDVVGVSSPVLLAAGATASVTVTASAAAALVAAGGTAGVSTAVTVATAATSAGIAAIVDVVASGSPSQ